jgi:hypothetical protein
MGRGIVIDSVLVRFRVLTVWRTSDLFRIIERSNWIPNHLPFGLFPSPRVSKILRTTQQCTYNLKLRCVRITIVAVEKQ